ncbi:MAG: LLM class flavin-dependent oxidoreductase [Pseudonocardiaceae bacterium]|nr:LLM class flavin-dependent oxidoreductase [Pseudonocardiaceae bacterium]
MQVFGFGLMPYRDIPREHIDSDNSSWVTFSNSHFDPERGAEFYAEYLEQFEIYDRLGFDGISVNEHHQTAYGLMPSPNLMAAMLVPRTSCKIAILGNAISLRDHPMRVAEEVAMLDVMSGGRIISGFVRGIGAEYHSFSMDPNDSRERFQEAHDLIVRSWTEPGPFEWYGKHYKLRYVNPWPRPRQNPHPPIWSPSQGSTETVSWAAERRYTYLQTYSPIENIRRAFTMFRDAANGFGYEPEPEQIGWALPMFLADTDKEARRKAAPHLEFLFNTLIRMPKDVFYPAGYLTEASAPRVMSAKSGLGTSRITAETLMDGGYALVGSPETVADQLAHYQSEMGFGTISGMFQFGTMGMEEFQQSVTLFGDKVLPKLRDLGRG